MSEIQDFSRLQPNSYQDTLAYRLCTLTSGCGALYIIGLTYYVREHSLVHGIPTIFTPIWAGLFLLISSLVTVVIHNNRSKMRLAGVLVILCLTLFTCAIGAFATAVGANYFISNHCMLERTGADNTRDNSNHTHCVCPMSDTRYYNFDNKLTVDTDSLHYCRNRVNVIKGLMMVTCLVCIMTISFLFMQLMVVSVQIKSSTSLAEMSNALIHGAGDELSHKYSQVETGGSLKENKEQSTKLVT